jgi:hypothetical protein
VYACALAAPPLAVTAVGVTATQRTVATAVGAASLVAGAVAMALAAAADNAPLGVLVLVPALCHSLACVVNIVAADAAATANVPTLATWRLLLAATAVHALWAASLSVAYG